MATTALLPLHEREGQTVAAAFQHILDYVKNPEKTEGGRLVETYQCDKDRADAEFTIAKSLYHSITGRRSEHDKVLAYMIRQSFSPGEITPEKALELGKRLAMEFTGGKHQFVVCCHTDKDHIHTHIVFNAVTLDYGQKFQNYKDSAAKVRELSDAMCRENGLSVVEEPDTGKSYKEWDAEKQGQSWKAKLREAIDAALPGCKTLDDLLAAMRSAGYEIKQGKYLSFRAPEQERFTRSKTLGRDYTVEALRERLGLHYAIGIANVKRQRRGDSGHVNLLVDIQARLQGKGPGLERWLKIHNLKEAAKTLAFLSEHGLTEYDALAGRTGQAAADFADVSQKIKAAESRMAQIAALKTHIRNYARTREVFASYKKSRFKEQYRAAHETEILLHEAAKRAFDALGVKKLPTVAALQAEYVGLVEQKKALYADYSRLKEESRELATVKQNVDRLLSVAPEQPEPERGQFQR